MNQQTATQSHSPTFNFPFNYVNENQNLPGSGASSNSFSAVGAALHTQQNALHMPNAVQMGGPSMQMAHHHLDQFPSYQNSLFNQEEAQFFNNFLNGFYEESPLDQDPIMFQQQQGNFNSSPTDQATSVSNHSGNENQHHQLKTINVATHTLLNPKNHAHLHRQSAQDSSSSMTSAVNAAMRNSMPFPSNSKEYHHVMKLEDPRLQQAQRNNYAALNLNLDASSKNSTATTNIVQVYPEHGAGADESSPQSYTSVSAAADAPTNSKKRGRPRKSTTTSTENPPKAAKVAKITPPLAPLIVSNIHTARSSAALSSAAPSPSFPATAQSGSVENYTTTSKQVSATTSKPPSKKASGSKSATTPRGDKELLTEEQKKTNHVLSEQRRRALIKEGFELLEKLTPSLAGKPVSTGPGNTGGCHSKSAVLFAAAKYIEELQALVNDLESKLHPPSSLL